MHELLFKADSLCAKQYILAACLLSKGKKVSPPQDGTYRVARQHHDFQPKGRSTGSYVPGQQTKRDGRLLRLTRENRVHPKINGPIFLDDVIIGTSSSRILRSDGNIHR